MALSQAFQLFFVLCSKVVIKFLWSLLEWTACVFMLQTLDVSTKKDDILGFIFILCLFVFVLFFFFLFFFNSPTSDGSAAVVLANENFVKKYNLELQAVEILGMEMATDLPSTFQDNSCIKLVCSNH